MLDVFPPRRTNVSTKTRSAPNSVEDVWWTVVRRCGPAWKWCTADLWLLCEELPDAEAAIMDAYAKFEKLLGQRLLPRSAGRPVDKLTRARREVQELAGILANLSSRTSPSGEQVHCSLAIPGAPAASDKPAHTTQDITYEASLPAAPPHEAFASIVVSGVDDRLDRIEQKIDTATAGMVLIANKKLYGDSTDLSVSSCDSKPKTFFIGDSETQDLGNAWERLEGTWTYGLFDSKYTLDLQGEAVIYSEGDISGELVGSTAGLFGAIYKIDGSVHGSIEIPSTMIWGEVHSISRFRMSMDEDLSTLHIGRRESNTRSE